MHHKRGLRRIAAAVGPLLVIGVLCLGVGSSAASAADGTILRTITAANYSCSVGTGIAFDGANLLLSCDDNNVITAVSPIDGSFIRSYTISGMGSIGALAWDRARQRLWACGGFGGDDTAVYRINLLDETATQQFSGGPGCPDGLAYNGLDDTLWLSPDVSPSVYHYSLTGNEIASFPISLGGCGNSGIAIGGAYLFLANDGCSQIYRTTPGNPGADLTLFGTYGARLEDMECDDISFRSSGKAVIWSKDAYDGILNAFELNPGDCGFGGQPSTSDQSVARNGFEPSMAVNPHDPDNVIVAYATATNNHGSADCAYATTFDGGAHWIHNIILAPQGLPQVGGDSSVAFGPNGEVYYACLTGGDTDTVSYLTKTSQNAVFVARSSDGGRTFGASSIVKEDRAVLDNGRVTFGTFDDQEDIAVGPNGIPYVCFNAIGRSTSNIQVAQATDASMKRWRIKTASGKGRSNGCSVAVTGSGRLWVAWWNHASDQAVAASSTSGVNGFSSPQDLGAKTESSTVDEEVFGRQVWIRADDRSGATGVVALWGTAVGDDDAAHLTLASASGTGPWSRRQLSGIFYPQLPHIAYGHDGSVAVGAYDGDFIYTVGRASSPSGSFAFGQVASQASALSVPSASIPRGIKPGLGDYTAVAVVKGSAWGAWTDDRNDDREIYVGR